MMRLHVTDADRAENPAVQAWLRECEDRMRGYVERVRNELMVFGVSNVTEVADRVLREGAKDGV